VRADGVVGATLTRALNDFVKGENARAIRGRYESQGTADHKLTFFRICLSDELLRRVTSALDSYVFPSLRLAFAPIPIECISNLKKNYSEQLPKTLRFKTALVSSRHSQVGRASAMLGITTLMKSEELRLFAGRVTGKKLRPNPNRQIICYEAGDFCGPHTDHHPEQRELRAGYVDAHIMLSEPNVMSQLLVYERDQGVLNTIQEVGIGVNIAIYQLPFWHYTTPLIPRPGARKSRRWVLAASYMLEQ
jgi:hypothetical protein